MAQARERVPDRRVQKTHTMLRGALRSLIHEKSYDSIAVQEILNRANVGRSTFYTHYRGKDDLLASAIHGMLAPARTAKAGASAHPRERILSFSLSIFEQLDRHRGEGAGRVGPKGRALLHEHLRRVIVESIADELRKNIQRRPGTKGRIPSDLLVHYMASTFVPVLDWWVRTSSRLTPSEVNEIYHAMVLPARAASEADA